MAVHVIITAGGELPRELHAHSVSRVKALLRVGERSLLDAALAAVEASTQAGDVAVVGNEDVLRALPRAALYAEAGATVVDNIWRGFLHHGGGLDAEYLVLSPDLPFVSGAALDAFIDAARACSEFAFPLVLGDDFVAHFPAAPNSFTRIDGVHCTMGSCIYITGRMLKTNILLFGDFFRSRKQPHKLAALLGLPIAISYLRGKLVMAQLERRASQLTGGSVRAVPSSHPGLAYDVDNMLNYEYAQKWLAGRRM